MYDFDELPGKIADCIIGKHINELLEDMNCQLNEYVHEILHKILVKHGDSITDEIIESEVDDYFETLYGFYDEMDECNSENEETNLEEYGIEFKGKDYIKKVIINNETEKSEDDLGVSIEKLSVFETNSEFDRLRKDMFEVIEGAVLRPTDKKRLIEATIRLFSYSSLNLMMVNELWGLIEESGKYNDSEQETLQKNLAERIRNNLKEVKAETIEAMKEEKNNKIIIF